MLCTYSVWLHTFRLLPRRASAIFICPQTPLIEASDNESQPARHPWRKHSAPSMARGFLIHQSGRAERQRRMPRLAWLAAGAPRLRHDGKIEGTARRRFSKKMFPLSGALFVAGCRHDRARTFGPPESGNTVPSAQLQLGPFVQAVRSLRNSDEGSSLGLI